MLPFAVEAHHGDQRFCPFQISVCLDSDLQIPGAVVTDALHVPRKLNPEWGILRSSVQVGIVGSVLAGPYRTSRARQIKFTRGIQLLFSFDLSVRFRLPF